MAFHKLPLISAIIIILFLGIYGFPLNANELENPNELVHEYVFVKGATQFGYFKGTTILDEEGVSFSGNRYLVSKMDSGAETSIDIHDTTFGIELAHDCTLLFYNENNIVNGKLMSQTQVVLENGRYLFNFTDPRGNAEVEELKVEEPLYFYDDWFPWTLEALLQKGVLVEDREIKAVQIGQGVPYDTINSLFLKKVSANNGIVEYLINERKDRITYNEKEKRIEEIYVAKDEFYIIPGKIDPKEVKPLDLTSNQAIPSDVFFVEPKKLTRLHLKMDLPYRRLKEEDLSSTRQSFTGVVTDDGVTGEIIVQVKKYDGENAPLFPVEMEWPAELSKYLQATPEIEADDLEIVLKAKGITSNSKTAWEAAEALGRWVYEKISYQKNLEASAKEVLQTGYGVCGEKALLTVAFCRAVNIPARLVGGIAYSKGTNEFFPHAWVEVFLGENGWAAIDPTWAQFSLVDATHIAFSYEERDQVFNGMEQKPEIKILSYEPTNVASMGQGISSSVLSNYATERTYKIFQQGTEVGEYLIHYTQNAQGKRVLSESQKVGSSEYTSELILDNQGYVIEYRKNDHYRGNRFLIEVFFYDSVIFKINDGRRQLSAPPFAFPEGGIILFDPYNFGQIALVLGQFLSTNEQIDMEATLFYINSIRGSGGYHFEPEISNWHFSVEPVEIQLGNHSVTGWVYTPENRGIKVYVTDKGLMTKLEIEPNDVSVVLEQ